MSKTIKIILYIAILLFSYFSISAIYKSCNNNGEEDLTHIDDTETSEEEDDFFDDFDSDEEKPDVTEDEESDEIDYKALDDRLKGVNTAVGNDIEEPIEYKSTPTVNKPQNAPQVNYTSPTYSNPSGKYLVVSGSFLVEQNAENLVVKLKRMGFENASVVVFDGSQYYTVISDRTNNHSTASTIVTKLKNNRIDSYIQTKKN